MKHPRRKEQAIPAAWGDLQEQALRMRRSPTAAEDRLWQELRGGRLNGLKFRRQHPVGRFIADFYCVLAGLVVEVDGPVHSEQREADQSRDLYLEAMGLRVLRFTNEEVLHRTHIVVRRIKAVVLESK